MSDNRLLHWTFLESETGKALQDLRVDEWQSKLADRTLKENDYHKFLSENAGFFLLDNRTNLVSISELQLGSDYRPDIVVLQDNRSLGPSYLLIELQSPHDSIFIGNGNMSKGLNEAVTQISDWKSWISQNSQEAKRLFPTQGANVNSFEYMIVIGRRCEKFAVTEARKKLSAHLGYSIRTYDYFTEKIKERMFSPGPMVFSSEMDQVSKFLKNKFSNPFVQCLSGAKWKSVVNQVNVKTSHFVAKNIVALLSHQSINLENEKQFLTSWEKAPQSLKDEHEKKTQLFFDT